MQPKCPEKTGESKSSRYVNTNCHLDSEGKGVFTTFSNPSDDFDDGDSIPELATVSDSDKWCSNCGADDYSDEDWFSEIGEDNFFSGSAWGSDSSSDAGRNWNEYPIVAEDMEIPEETTMATITNKGAEISSCTELFNSGCTAHMTPYKERLEKFLEIPPRSFCLPTSRILVLLAKERHQWKFQMEQTPENYHLLKCCIPWKWDTC